MKTKLCYFSLFGIMTCFLFCCSENDGLPKGYEETFETYHEELAEGRVKYLQLCGLFKIPDSPVSFGKNAMNNFQLAIQDIPDTLGILIPSDSLFHFIPNTEIEVGDSKLSSGDTLKFSRDQNGNGERVYHDRINWQVITRANSPYLRVWDEENPMVERFNGYETYDLNANYILDAQFEYYSDSKVEKVDTQLGPQAETSFIGRVLFEFLGKTYSLDVGNNGFTMVHDLTSGDETYGGGRYIYIDLPGENGSVTLDFNRLYNPPCSFSQFTTCLYPPAQNRLDFEILAGEKIRRIP